MQDSALVIFGSSIIWSNNNAIGSGSDFRSRFFSGVISNMIRISALPAKLGDHIGCILLVLKAEPLRFSGECSPAIRSASIEEFIM